MILRNSKQLISLATLAIACTFAQAADIKVYVDGDMVNFDNQGPKMMGQRVYVPLRGVFEKLGANVVWDNNEQSITCEKPPTTIWLKIGDRQATVDQKAVMLDQPAVLYRGVTMVPLRFVSECLGADVHWNDALQAVNITSDGTIEGPITGGSTNTDPDTGTLRTIALDTGTVLPVMLDVDLSSKFSNVGDKFTATIGTKASPTYAGLPQGSMVTGHVVTARPKTSKDPGVLAVEFESIVTPSGAKIPIDGSLIGLDNKSVETKDDLIIARNSKSDNNHQNVWIGAGAGAVIALITKGNVLTTSAIGAALGYLYDQLKLGGSNSKDVSLDKGTTFGVKLDRNLVARVEK